MLPGLKFPPYPLLNNQHRISFRVIREQFIVTFRFARAVVYLRSAFLQINLPGKRIGIEGGLLADIGCLEQVGARINQSQRGHRKEHYSGQVGNRIEQDRCY